MSHIRLLRYIPIKEGFMKELDVVRLLQEFNGFPAGMKQSFHITVGMYILVELLS